jgi:hypothetical protein
MRAHSLSASRTTLPFALALSVTAAALLIPPRRSHARETLLEPHPGPDFLDGDWGWSLRTPIHSLAQFGVECQLRGKSSLRVAEDARVLFDSAWTEGSCTDNTGRRYDIPGDGQLNTGTWWFRMSSARNRSQPEPWETGNWQSDRFSFTCPHGSSTCEIRGEDSFECKGGGHDGVKFRRTGGAPNRDRGARAEDAYYAFQDTSTPQDRERELRALARGAFTRIPGSGAGKSFHDVCASIGSSCEVVLDWEGRRHGCNSGAHDGSRMALCAGREDPAHPRSSGEPYLYGALAFDEKTRAHGWAIDQPTPDAAAQRALQECQRHTCPVGTVSCPESCSIVLQFSNECAVYVRDDKGGTVYAWAKAKSLPEAQHLAASECIKRGGSCMAQVWGCTARR